MVVKVLYFSGDASARCQFVTTLCGQNKAHHLSPSTSVVVLDVRISRSHKPHLVDRMNRTCV